MLEVHKENDTCDPKPLLETENYSLSPFNFPLTLYTSLTNSDCLFFIWYISENTLKLYLFLVQTSHAESTFLDLD